MPNNFMNKAERSAAFAEIADKLNESIQDYLKETNQDSIDFSIGMLDFHVKKKEIEE